MTHKSKSLCRLPMASCERGIAATEFALIAPTFVLMLMGVFDLAYGMYVKGVLQGAVEAAGRNASLENTTTASIDTKVRVTIGNLNRTGTLSVGRLYYEKYSEIAVPEDFTDSNTNSVRDDGECFIDRNGNAEWDEDVGLSGRGGAQDVVVYNASFTYDRLFPLYSIMGQSGTQVITAKTFLRNQPFSAQAARTGVTICT